MKECVFCRILRGEIPGYKVFEDEHTLVFMSNGKDVDGHMLAIPKKHVKSVLDCDEETLFRLMSTVKKVSEHCISECGYDGVNLLNASEESAGQSVPHLHIHIIPRKKGDNVNAWPELPGLRRDTDEVFEELKYRC